MATTADLDKLATELRTVAKGFTGRDRDDVLRALQVPSEKAVESAVRGDLGDLSMSGWATGPIVGKATVRDGALVVTPKGKLGGPMRVLESGRNQGNASGFQGPGANVRTGTTRRTKSGQVAKVRARQGRRWNGRTRGKGTWTDAEKRIEQVVVAELPDAIVKKVGDLLG